MLWDIIDIVVSILIISERPFGVKLNFQEFLNSIQILPLYFSCSMQEISRLFAMIVSCLH